MNETKLMLLCGSRMALPVMRDLVFYQQLAAVVIPEHCAEFTQEVTLLLKESAISVLTVTRKDFVTKLQEAIENCGITIGLMVTFSYKLPAVVYNLPRDGFFNLHPGPLPGYRGPDPIFWQIKNREPYVGIAIHKVADDFDTGGVVLSDKIKLAATDTHGMLTTKLAELAARLTGVLVKMAGFGIAIPSRPQDETKAVYYKKQTAADITINWQTMNAEIIIAMANACNPWNKGVVTKLNDKIIRILQAEKITVEESMIQSTSPGVIVAINDQGVFVSAKNGVQLCIKYIYTDEGFLDAARLIEFGISPGNAFQII